MCRFLKMSLLAALSLTLFSCDKNKTYAEYLEDEREAIGEYISNNKIKVVDELPEGDGEWLTEDGNPIYVKSESGLYYHQVEKGDGKLKPGNGYTVYFRFVGKNMLGVPIYDCTERYTANPQSLVLSNVVPYSSTSYGSGFQEALRNMRAGGHCKTIIPFKIGNETLSTVNGTLQSDATDYIPMAYEIWLLRVE